MELRFEQHRLGWWNSNCDFNSILARKMGLGLPLFRTSVLRNSHQQYPLFGVKTLTPGRRALHSQAPVVGLSKSVVALFEIMSFLTFMFKCTTEHVQNNGCCSICSEPVSTDNQRYKECISILDRLFPEIEVPQAIPSGTLVASSNGDETLTVSMMGGETTVIPYQGNMTVLALKYKVQERFGVEPHKQRLLHNEKELKVRKQL